MGGYVTLYLGVKYPDDVEMTGRMGVGWKTENDGSRAVQVQWMNHVWILHDLALFAKCVQVR